MLPLQLDTELSDYFAEPCRITSALSKNHHFPSGRNMWGRGEVLSFLPRIGGMGMNVRGDKEIH